MHTISRKLLTILVISVSFSYATSGTTELSPAEIAHKCIRSISIWSTGSSYDKEFVRCVDGFYVTMEATVKRTTQDNSSAIALVQQIRLDFNKCVRDQWLAGRSKLCHSDMAGDEKKIYKMVPGLYKALYGREEAPKRR